MCTGEREREREREKLNINFSLSKYKKSLNKLLLDYKIIGLIYDLSKLYDFFLFFAKSKIKNQQSDLKIEFLNSKKI